MLHRSMRSFLIGATAILISLILNSWALGAACGDGIKPCACGDTLTASRTLSSADPIVGAACAGNGLTIGNAGVTLDLNGNTINGSGGGVGLLIGADDVTLLDGRVISFETGIGTDGLRFGATINAVSPNNNAADGVLLEGDRHELINSPARHNGNNGVSVIGNENQVSGANHEYNGFDGIFVRGDGNELTSNSASENAKHGPGNGITVIGNDNTLTLNSMTKLNTNGIVVEGDRNRLISNRATKQRADGITVTGDNNVLTNNKATETKGILVQGVVGNPSASSGNVVNRGVCIIYGVTGQGICTKK